MKNKIIQIAVVDINLGDVRILGLTDKGEIFDGEVEYLGEDEETRIKWEKVEQKFRPRQGSSKK